ncbi:MAG TPA: PspC domain-containing protein [Microlunatus sp.]|nr:PspC domain-containing protein [Microlunatus sp.]
MNQTQGPSSTDEQQSTTEQAQQTAQQAQPGVDRQHLRSYEQLRRSVTDRKVAGVAGGLGRHLNIDPTVLRVLFVVLCFFGGAGFVAYGVAWLLVPEEGKTDGIIAMNENTRNGVLIVGGVVAALLLVGDSWGGIGFPWPVFLVGVGVLIYLAFRGRAPRAGQQPPPPAFYGPAAPTEGEPGGVTATGTTYGESSGIGYAEQPPAPPWVPAPPVAPYQPPRPKSGPKLFGITLALVAVALGALGLYDVAGGSVVDSAYPALALTVVGVMLVVGAWVGRAGGLIFLGIVATFALAVTSVLGTFKAMDLRDGQRIDVAPVSAARVLNSYEVRQGQVSVDLSRVSDPEALGGRVIHVGGTAAEVLVVLPRGVESDVTAGIDGPGQIDLPDRHSGGINTHLAGVYGTGSSTVTIDTHLAVGHIEVRNP